MTKPPNADKKRIEEVPTRDLVDSIRAELEYERLKAEQEEAERKKKLNKK
jgi:hypothetical protein